MSIYESEGASSLISPLNLSDLAIYDVVAKKITIPPQLINTTGVFICSVDLYVPASSYPINQVVLSDGTSGGVVGACYRSLTNNNSGNLLSDITNWVFTDSTSTNIGNLEVATFGNPNSLPTDHTVAFRITPGSLLAPSFQMMFISGTSSPAAGELFLDLNTNILLTNQYSEISFAVVDTVSVKQPAPIQ